MNYMIVINETDLVDVPRSVRVERAEKRYRLPSDRVVNETEGYTFRFPDWDAEVAIRDALLKVARMLDAIPPDA